MNCLGVDLPLYFVLHRLNESWNCTNVTSTSSRPTLLSSQLFCKISFIHYTSNIHFTFYNHNQQVNLFTIYCHKWRKVSWIKNNLSDFNKIAKQLMDDWNQKKHFSSKFQILCSKPVSRIVLPNSTQVFPKAYSLIISWLPRSWLLKESV